MGKFLRSPSKVWWEASNNSASWRSASSGSQDSGFSDTETSPGAAQAKNAPEKKIFEISLGKGQATNDDTSKQNLSSNIKEKETPHKNVNLTIQKGGSLQCTPQRFTRMTPISNTAPVGKYGNKLHSHKVSRSLFQGTTVSNNKNIGISVSPHQYSKRSAAPGTRENLNNSEDKVTSYLNDSSMHNDSVEEPSSVKSLPAISNSNSEAWPVNLSAPAVLAEEENLISFDNSISSSDSELECLFQDNLASPKHTSTPKSNPRQAQEFDLRRKFAMNLLNKYKEESYSQASANNDDEERKDLQQWIKETRFNYEPECMTALQCKSIAGELSEKVNQLASAVTLTIRDLINYNAVIENEFLTLKNHKKYMKPLIQSLNGIITEFLQKYAVQENCILFQQCEILKIANEIDLNRLLPKLHLTYKTTYQRILNHEMKKFLNYLEDPFSDIHLRATLTGLTSIALRNEELIGMFTKEGAVETLVILCEKCEGSSMRALTLRALSTICCNASSIRQFERSSGIQAIVDTLVDESRPEPERSEAVALLAQITAPWIDDNHTINGLVNHDKKLVKAITKFIHNTKCCQNLLLCTAALANLTTMENESIRFINHYNTVDILLKAVKRRGPRASVYLLEQVAILLANVSAVEEIRKQLTKNEAPAALLCFLQASCVDDAIVKRVQQKSMVALSRLCSEPEAARQVVSLGGVERLIHLCREKDERCNSDAVLVAALVTLRKIIESCGTKVMSSQDAQELVEPRLLDSFLAYSTQNESYV